MLAVPLALILTAGLFTLSGTVVVAAGGVFVWTEFTRQLPAIEEARPLGFQTTKIYDRHWRLLHEISDPRYGWRTEIGYHELLDQVAANRDRPGAPRRAWIIDATVAAEDGTFWINPGVDPLAIARSLVGNLTGQPMSGASTITQQLVRALYPEAIGFERSYLRKLREAVMAYEFTRRFSKEQILEMYLNNVFYGNRSYGIDAAARSYFNKFAWELSLAEAAMLAGLPQAPSLYDPTRNYALAKARQRYVLDRMVARGMITRAEADAAYAEPLHPQRREGRYQHAPHFVNFVRHYLDQRFGAERLYRGGLMVRTSIDLELQETAQQIVSEHIATLAPRDASNGALVAMLPWSGEILAMVGSADFHDEAIAGQVNVAVRERQPGSTIKPAVYLAAFEQGWHPGTKVFDYAKRWPTPRAVDPYYAPRNASNRFYGAISVREALGNSLNIPAVQAIDYVGVERMIEMARRLGIRTSLWHGMDHHGYGLSLALGGGEVLLLEITNAYATLANTGRFVPYAPVLEIIGPDGERIFELDRAGALERAEQVVRPEHAYQMTHILSDNDARRMVFGERSPLVLAELDHRPAAAKTGTTEDFRDGWAMGYTTDLVVGVWVGNTDNRPMRRLGGVRGAAPIWNELMVRAHTEPVFAELLLGPDGQPLPLDFPRPADIVEAKICAATGKRPIPGARTVTEVLIAGEQPRQRCDQLDDAEARELRAALEDARRNPRFTARGIESLRDYARMVNVQPRLDGTPTPEATPTSAP